MGCYKHGDELLIPWKAGYFVATWATISFSRTTVLHRDR